LRIVPAYWAALFLITTVFHWTSIGPGGWWAYFTHYTFLQIYFWNQWIHGITQSWTLCVEMTFYLFIPVYALLIDRFSRQHPKSRLNVELLGLGAMVAVSFLWRSIVFATIHQGHSQTLRLATQWLPSFLDLFALGMLLAVSSAWTHQHHREPSWIKGAWVPYLSWALALLCFWGSAELGISFAPLYVQHFPDLARQTLFGLFAFFLLLPAVFGPQDRGLIRWALRSWPLASLGVVSYGFYLWHQAVIEQLIKARHLVLFKIDFWPFFAAVLILSTAIATISYFMLERPALQLKATLGWWGKGQGPPKSIADPADPSA
jgi:peptidoglycan/LPS O-acetylase OafA/YrhL